MMSDTIAAATDKATQTISDAVSNSVAASQERLLTRVASPKCARPSPTLLARSPKYPQDAR